MAARDRRFSFRNDSEFKDADRYAKEFTPKDGVDYEWVTEYAKEHYGRIDKGVDNLEQKADSIINYLGAYTGLLSLASIYSVSAVHWSVAVSALPTFVLSVAAMKEAASARSPIDKPIPPDVLNAIEFAEAYGSDAQATFIPRFGAASKGMKAVNGEKARLVNNATKLMILAFAALALPIIAAAVHSYLAS